MTCRRARKLLPLLAGDDLAPKKTRRIERHLSSCPACRAEMDELRAALDTVKSGARGDEVPAWDESAWAELTRRIATEPAPRRLRPRLGPIPIPSPALTAGLSAAALIAVLAFVFKGDIFRSSGKSPVPVRATAALETPAATSSAAQDRLSVTLVSQETGLQVVWIFDKNFEWKGEQN